MCDQFGHLNVRYYAHIFDDASFALWPLAGIGRALFEQAGVHTVVARTETDFRKEIHPGRVVAVRSRFVTIGTKSVTYEQQLRDIDDDTLHAQQRAVEVFFDPKTRTACSMPDAIRKALSQVTG